MDSTLKTILSIVGFFFVLSIVFKIVGGILLIVLGILLPILILTGIVSFAFFLFKCAINLAMSCLGSTILFILLFVILF